MRFSLKVNAIRMATLKFHYMLDSTRLYDYVGGWRKLYITLFAWEQLNFSKHIRYIFPGWSRLTIWEAYARSVSFEWNMLYIDYTVLTCCGCSTVRTIDSLQLLWTGVKALMSLILCYHRVKCNLLWVEGIWASQALLNNDASGNYFIDQLLLDCTLFTECVIIIHTKVTQKVAQGKSWCLSETEIVTKAESFTLSVQLIEHFYQPFIPGCFCI